MSDMEFDYIIVGAGSAGCVLADCLTRNGRTTVLVIEAGGSDARFWIKVPVGYGFTFSDPRVNWRYSAEPDPGLNARVGYWPRGRVIGGSGSINAMAWVCGQAHDFNDWEGAGAAGWNWSTAQPVFERLVSHSETGPDGRARIRGSGPLRVSDLSARMHPFSSRFLEAAQELGWPLTDDMNGDQPEGLSRYRSTVRNGIRCSPADAFLRPALRRGNVRVLKHALVERLLIRDGQATGVQYSLGNRTMTAHARGEVIVSAGAVNSPQLLQLSGIGPAGLLRSHGIDVVSDLSQVRRGLQDHLAITHHFIATEPTLNTLLSRRSGQFRAGLQYLLTRRGPLSVPVNQVGGFIRSEGTAVVPDMQVFCNPVSYSTQPGGAPRMDHDPGFILSAQPCRPTSRGEIMIASADPREAPLIQPNSLSTEADRAAAVRAGRLLRLLAGTPTIRRVTRAPKPPDISVMTDAEMLENFRDRAATVFHPCCTCRMGDDPAASVLDERLRVHGIGRLRVVDASSFPNITSGNINAPTMMLAMRAADLILEDAQTTAHHT